MSGITHFGNVATFEFDDTPIEPVYIGSTTAHKKGNTVIFKPNDIYTALSFEEMKDYIKGAYHTNGYVTTTLFNKSPKQSKPILKTWDNKFSLSIADIITQINNNRYKSVEEAIKDSFVSHIFQCYKISLNVSSQLINYINKEARQVKLESAFYPTTPIESDLPLFNRCVVGTALVCINDYKLPSGTIAFNKGKKYLVIETGEETDKITISTSHIQDNSVISSGKGARIDWSEFDGPMEEYFTDSEAQAPKEHIKTAYPELVAAMAKRLDKITYDIFDHTKEDAVLEALKRGTLNCKIQRLGKSREAITIANLVGSQKVAIITTKNIRLFWVREFEKINIKDYVIVNKLKDLDRKARFYLISYTFLRSVNDPFAKLKKDHKNYLKKSTRQVQMIAPGYTSKKKTKTIPQFNYCPHCKGELQRRERHNDGIGNISFEWTSNRGYICNNSECSYITDNSKKQGAAWQSNKLIVHKNGSYVDVFLAKHAHCDEDLIKGRICNDCKLADSTWTPPTYKRVSKKFTMIIADEIHNAKDRGTQTAAGLYNLRARRKIGLTGTPMSNSPMDVYYPMQWIFGAGTNAFPFQGKDGFKSFEDRFCQHVYIEKLTDKYDENGNRLTEIVKKRQPFLANPTDFWDFIGPKIVRRNYSDKLYLQSLVTAGLKLPKSEIQKIPCDMNVQQTQLMIAAVQDFKKVYTDIIDKAKEDKSQINEALIITKMSLLRTIATAPERLNERFGTEIYNGSPGGGKLPNIASIVKDKISKGEKVLILSDFIDMQKACEQALQQYNPIRFQTNWNEDNRDKAFKSFAEDKERKVFIAGTRTVREGVDLSPANSVICCDLLWSPAFQAQAWSRTLAPTKEDRSCDIYLMVSKHSLDEHIFNVFYSKMTAAEQAFDRKALTKRAQVIDIREFVDKVLNDAMTLSLNVRDFDDGTVYNPTLNLMEFNERF